MKITAKHIKALGKAGIDADSHHAKIKKAFREAFDHKLDKSEVEVIRNLMDGSTESSDKPEKETVALTPEALLSNARAYAKKIGQKGSRVVEVTDVTSGGNPARVVVKCIDPQTNGTGESVCADTREVAVQDMFQVVRCVPCQKRSVQIYRNRLARARRSELRERRAS